MSSKTGAYPIPAFIRSRSPGTSVVRNMRVVRTVGLVGLVLTFLYLLSNGLVSSTSKLIDTTVTDGRLGRIVPKRFTRFIWGSHQAPTKHFKPPRHPSRYVTRHQPLQNARWTACPRIPNPYIIRMGRPGRAHVLNRRRSTHSFQNHEVS